MTKVKDSMSLIPPEKFLRECLDRADTLSNVQARSIEAHKETIAAYLVTIKILQDEIERLNEIIRVYKEAR
jgi:hypothetical protein